MSNRAVPLPPDERRAALVDATVPLLHEHGADLSTRQIAEAAGVAEGTIFRVFADKDALIEAAIAKALDPAPAVRRLAAIDPEASLEDSLTTAVTILQERLSEVFHLIVAMTRRGRPHQPGKRPMLPENTAILDALSGVCAAHEGQLRLSPPECARIVRLVVFAGSHPRITDDNPLSAREIVDLLLNGITTQETRTTGE